MQPKFLLTFLLCSSWIGSIYSKNNPLTWVGKWFPNAPGKQDSNLLQKITYQPTIMGEKNILCDDGINNLANDYDYKNMSNHIVHMCMESKSKFTPNITVQPLQREYTIPPEYSALHKCMNETIVYDDRVPTFGTHRPIWPVYGEYLYVPPQRWLHSLEHGAIVLLYHPCANIHQLNQLKKIVKNCLYRHIITSSDRLQAMRPYALIAWGKSLEFSYIDTDIIYSFIKSNALMGPEKLSDNGQYNVTLLEPAMIISDINDTVLCQS